MKLIFVYNANSGFFDAVSDYAHKVFSPSTYTCSLCRITHGHFGPKKEWKNFLEHTEHNLEFHHKDDWEKEGNSIDEYPVVLHQNQNETSTLINAEELNGVKSIQQLIELLELRTSSANGAKKSV